jgi:uroporphyrinogen-III synthase
MQVLITRAKDQAHSHIAMCHRLALIPISLASVEISINIKNNSFVRAISQFSKTDIVIVVSANAATIAAVHWPSSPNPPTIFAIGPATANAIENLGYRVHYVADPPNSESLLSLPALQESHIKHKKITLFCGYAPKPLLKDTLEQRKANVQLAFCYERICPIPLTQQAWESRISISEPFITISTSAELLHHLVFITPTAYLNLLKSSPLIVISDNMVSQAQALGFNQVIQAKNASVEAIETALKRFLAIACDDAS